MKEAILKITMLDGGPYETNLEGPFYTPFFIKFKENSNG